MCVSIKSPLNTWSLQLPRTLKLLELWELSFRLTKGRYMRFELQHKNAPLPPSQDTIESAVNAGHTVFLTPLDTAPVADQDTPTEELCLVKLYAESYARPLTSYWEPKKTTRSLGSALFRYYRHKFMMEPTTRIEDHVLSTTTSTASETMVSWVQPLTDHGCQCPRFSMKKTQPAH
jgi:hypothetical protein